jgi:predicted nucleotidyltransferase
MKLASVLRDLATHLKQVGLEFAVVGGIAVSARAEPRFTRDVDVAVAVTNDDQAERGLFSLKQLGYVVTTTVERKAMGRLATARLRHPSGIVCDIIFATCGIEPEIVAQAEPLDVFEDLDVPTATTDGLLAMKVLSATDQRPRDLEDIRALLQSVPGYDEDRVLELLGLIEKRGFHRQHDLVAKWAVLKERFSPSHER